MDSAGVVGTFLTVLGTIFVLELTDKDALLLLSLATRKSARLVFAAGSIAFTLTSAVIVLVGSALVSYVPVAWIKLAGGGIMLAYAAWNYIGGMEGEDKRLLAGAGRSEFTAFLVIVASLALLDLGGDATEVVTILFVAQYRDLLLVFLGATVALIAASGLEAVLGNRLGRILSARRTRYLSTALLLAIGTAIVFTSVLGF